MKLSLIAVFLLAGCAHGSEIDVEEIAPAVEAAPKIPTYKPTPIEDSTEIIVKCTVKIYSENGCIVYSFRCEGLPTREEVVCSPPPVWPWEMPPDPIDYR